ncbi:MAG: glycerol kinase GlpK [Anaerolineae bacterium]|nr:glycerol kinase GlpK [Anaerolineae bacterium]
MNARFILSLDQGTTSSRAIVFDQQGQPKGSAQREFRQIYPQPGWVEHDANEIWATQYAVAQEALERTALTAERIAAIGITNQRETTVIWDRATGEPIANAIVWQCRRTAPFCEILKAEGFDQAILAKTGLITDAYFSGTKVAWLLDNIPGARQRAERGELAFGTMDSFLIWRLTEGRVHATDVSNASRTMLFNIHSLEWDDEILARLDIPRSLLPEVRSSSGDHGETALFGAPIPITGVAGDQQAATFGQACHQPGMAKNTYGTGCFMLLNTGEEAVASHNRLLTTIGWKLGDAKTVYMLEGSVFIAGAAVQWLRDELRIVQNASETEELASSLHDNGGVYFVPAFVGLGAPYWNAFARGAVVGLTRGSGRAHFARAALEAVAFQTRDVADAMAADSGIPLHTLRVDGGMVHNTFLMQFQADILGVPVQPAAVPETTALGAAYLAGLAVGYWPSPAALAVHWRAERTYEPNMSADERESLYADWKRAVNSAQS